MKKILQIIFYLDHFKFKLNNLIKQYCKIRKTLNAKYRYAEKL